MKKSVINLVLIMFALCATTAHAQIRIGALGGMNASRVIMDGNDLDYKVGWQLGIIGEYEIMDNLYAQSGLKFTNKGGREQVGDNIYKSTTTYLDIPIHALYKYNLGEISVYGKSGFDIGVGLFGKNVSKIDGNKNSESIKWGSDDADNLKRMEVGFHLEAGVELMGNIQLGISYNWGLNDISASGTDGVKNRVFAMTAIYFFGKL